MMCVNILDVRKLTRTAVAGPNRIFIAPILYTRTHTHIRNKKRDDNNNSNDNNSN